MSGRNIRHFLIAGFCLAVLLPVLLPAQDDDTPAADAAAVQETLEAPAERIIYLPFERLEDVLDQQNSSVIIPYPEYIRLWSKAEGADTSEGTKVDAVITRAAYVATVEGDVARIKAELTVRVFGKPWVEVPLDFGEAAVGGVTSETGEVLLRGTGEGKYALLLKEQGEQQVSLELTTRVVTSPDGREISFATPSVAVTTFELVIPKADQDVEVRPRLVQLPVDGEEGVTRVKASLGATGRIAAKWHARASMKPEMELLASVTNLQTVSIADGLIHSDAALTYSILRGELEQVRLVVPKGQRVLDVTASARIRKWQTADEENRQVITVDLLAPATDKLTVEVHTEAKLGEGDLSVAGIDESGSASGIHALDVVRESGQLVVTHGADLTLRVIEQSGLVRIDSESVAKTIRPQGAGAGALAYKFFSPQFVLQVAAAPVEPRVVVDHVARIEIREDQLVLDAGLTYTIERAGLFELRLIVPDELEITRVDSEAMESFRVEGDSLVISLRQQMMGAVVVTVTGEQPLPADGEQFDLPLLEPQDVERERGTVRLFAREAVEVATNEDELESALPDALGGNRQQASSDLRASWRFTRRPVKIPVTVTRKPTRLTAQVATDVDVQPTRTRITTNVDFLVEYAGLDTFRIDIPEAAMPTLQIEAVASEPTSPALRETTAGEPVEGWVTHTLTMQRPVTGRQRFRITYDLQPTEVEPDSQPDGGDAMDGDDASAAAEPAAGDADAAAAAPADTKAADDANPDNDADSADDKPDAEPDVDRPFATGAAEAAIEAAAEADPKAVEMADEPESEADDTPAIDEPADDDPTDGESNEVAEPDVVKLETAIWIIRPLGLDADDDIEATALSLVTGEVRLGKEESLTITADATGSDIEPMDVRELRLLPAQGTLAFRYRQHNADETIAVTITQARYDVQEMLATVVSRAVVEVMLGDDPTATFRCRYRIKSTQRQRLELRLPKGIELLSVLVNDSEVRLEPSNINGGPLWDSYFVNVSRSGESDEAFHLTLQFLFSFSEPPFDAGFMRGRIPVPLPIVGSDDGSAATQELRTIVWVPQEYAFIGDPTGFVLDGFTRLSSALLGGPKRFFTSHDDDDWVGCQSAGGLDFPTGGRVDYRYTNLGGQGIIKLLWWDTEKVTIVVSLALAIIALVLLRTDWENKLGILLLIAFGAVLLGLKNMHVLAHALSAMRFGLAFMVGVWAIHALFGQRTTAASTAAAGSAADGVTSATPPYAAPVPPPGVFDQFQPPKSESDDDQR